MRLAGWPVNREIRYALRSQFSRARIQPHAQRFVAVAPRPESRIA